MTLLRSILFLTFFSLSSCSSLHAFLWDKEKPAAFSTEKKVGAKKRISSNQFAWAVQNFEAGRYEKSLRLFLKLKAQGPQLEDFELISFYLGMSHFRLNELALAQKNLEFFIQQRLDLHQTQVAKLTLLSIFESEKKWNKILGLAAEMNTLSLFQDSRAYLKLSWARALRENKEHRSALLMLKEARDYLDVTDVSQLRPSQPDQDLWGKYHSTELLLALDECGALEPKIVGKESRLETWVDASADCLRRSFSLFSENLVSNDSPWITFAEENYLSSLNSFFVRYQGLEKKQSLTRRRKLDPLMKSSLYRLHSEMETQKARLKDRSLSLDPIERIRKRIDSLLISLSQPSS